MLLAEIASTLIVPSVIRPFIMEGYRFGVENLNSPQPSGSASYLGRIISRQSSSVVSGFVENLNGIFVDLRDRLVRPTNQTDAFTVLKQGALVRIIR